MMVSMNVAVSLIIVTCLRIWPTSRPAIVSRVNITIISVKNIGVFLSYSLIVTRPTLWPCECQMINH